LSAAHSLTAVMQAQVEFHEKFNVPVNPKMQATYAKLVEEEHEEWVEEYYGMDSKEYDELKELADLLYVTAGLAYQYKYDLTKTIPVPAPHSYEALITEYVSDIASNKRSKYTLSELMYAIFCYADAMNWNLNEAYKRVHESNLSKLGEDGKPIYREDGKVLKGPNYKPADLTDLTEGR